MRQRTTVIEIVPLVYYIKRLVNSIPFSDLDDTFALTSCLYRFCENISYEGRECIVNSVNTASEHPEIPATRFQCLTPNQVTPPDAFLRASANIRHEDLCTRQTLQMICFVRRFSEKDDYAPPERFY
ncbi:unnamed protein product [Dicrocoelium dendriticum]|nr:unnamed protein product [Dicrocoelium dendriticum]